jgi:hypothetical protein
VLSPAAMTKIKIILHKPKVILDNKFWIMYNNLPSYHNVLYLILAYNLD